MKTRIVIVVIGLALNGCGSGFQTGGSSSSAIPSLGPNDVVGAGGSIALMQSGSDINTGILNAQSVNGPGGLSFVGGWTTGCVAGNNSSNVINMAVDGYNAFMVIRIYVNNTTCNAANLDMIETRHYTYASNGTAPVSFAANTLSSFLVQVIQQPQTQDAAAAIEDDCNYAPGTIDVLDEVDVSICNTYDSNSGSSSVTAPKVGVTDTSGVFYTNGSVLRLGDASGLAAPGTAGYFTKQ